MQKEVLGKLVVGGAIRFFSFPSFFCLSLETGISCQDGGMAGCAYTLRHEHVSIAVIVFIFSIHFVFLACDVVCRKFRKKLCNLQEKSSLFRPNWNK